VRVPEELCYCKDIVIARYFSSDGLLQ
jgi:hypothetical protein